MRVEHVPALAFHLRTLLSVWFSCRLVLHKEPDFRASLGNSFAFLPSVHCVLQQPAEPCNSVYLYMIGALQKLVLNIPSKVKMSHSPLFLLQSCTSSCSFYSVLTLCNKPQERECVCGSGSMPWSWVLMTMSQH